jgi:hypothetical protein
MSNRGRFKREVVAAAPTPLRTQESRQLLLKRLKRIPILANDHQAANRQPLSGA